MKRFACLKIATMTGVLVFLTAMYGICADEASKTPAAAEGVPPVKSEARSKEEGAKGEAFTVTLKAPLGSPLFADCPVATVNDDKITLDDITKNLEVVHQKVGEEESTGHKKSLSDLLNRLISIKLLVQEARNMELDKVPELKAMLAAESQNQLKAQLFSKYLKDVKPDEKEIEEIYRTMNQEAKLKQLVFSQGKDANKFVQEVRAGKNFDVLAEKVVQDGTAEASKGGSYIKVAVMQPSYAKMITKMKNGDISSPILVIPNVIVFKLEELRLPEDPAKREEARTMAVGRAQNRVMEKRKAELFKKFMKQNTKLIKSLDFEAKKPGFSKMLADKRVIVAVKGDKSITVADLAAAMRDRLTHGIERAIQERKVNAMKTPVLNTLMARIVIKKEALEEGLDKTPQYTARIAASEEMTLFGAFVEKVLKPEVKISQEDFKAYYDAHVNEEDYGYPEMVKIQSIVFKKKEAAQKSIEKLRQGMDLKWLMENAEDQVGQEGKDVLNFGDQLVTTTSMPEGAQKALEGVKSDEYRLYEAPEGYFYILHVEKLIPKRHQTLEEAMEKVGPAVYTKKLDEVMQGWVKKLREAAEVKVYAEFDR